jgi:hypothetical protein
MGEIGCISFFPSKNLGGFGDGGMVLTNDEALGKKLAALRMDGSIKKYYHEWVGINSRLDTPQAAVLKVKFRYLDAWSPGRQANAARYRELLAGVDGIGLPHVAVPDAARVQPVRGVVEAARPLTVVPQGERRVDGGLLSLAYAPATLLQGPRLRRRGVSGERAGGQGVAGAAGALGDGHGGLGIRGRVAQGVSQGGGIEA